ncbi:MAG: fumarylacetoacetate hydrolase family protein [Dehalococcoidia bacterium]|nr:fumarylacetoacetate hydrolase family protein [Dehalococcoidia bacterium]
MKIARFRRYGRVSWGLIEGERVRPMTQFNPPAEIRLSTELIPLSAVTLLAPIAPTRNIFCLGRNYVEHIKEGSGAGAPLPAHPIWFTKAPSVISAPNSDVVLANDLTSQLDYEVELAVVIGHGGKRIPEERALEHVFGYTVFNDLTARDLQNARGGQWFLGKSIDGTGPAGPWLVTADELPDPQALTLSLRVNGEERQRASTAEMIFPVRRAIADLSKHIRLAPGDVIATGTPSGVAMGRDPAPWLRDGDVVEAAIDGIGVLRNRIRFVDPDDAP